MTEPSSTRTSLWSNTRIIVEVFTALLAIVIIIGGFVLIGISFTFVDDPGQFTRVKDILLFVNPILGIVIGYYFNKNTSDARAETAEKAAQTAVDTAQHATKMQDDAKEKAQQAENSEEEMRSALEDVTQKAGEMIDQVGAAPAPSGEGTLSFGIEGAAVPAESMIKTRVELQSALARAQKVLRK